MVSIRYRAWADLHEPEFGVDFCANNISSASPPNIPPKRRPPAQKFVIKVFFNPSSRDHTRRNHASCLPRSVGTKIAYKCRGCGAWCGGGLQEAMIDECADHTVAKPASVQAKLLSFSSPRGWRDTKRGPLARK
jgi:hypothetical protein